MTEDTIKLVAKGLIVLAAGGLVATAGLLALGVSPSAVALVSSLTGVAFGALASPLSSNSRR